MELGKAVLKRNGINTLSHAVHPKYGLAWTDGKDIFLVPVKHVIKGNSEPDKQIRLGSFQCVTYVSWSPVFISPSYLSVVHNDTVSLWLIDGTSTSLTSKQLRKISVTPIPQGCLWNPSCDILCVLTSKHVNFYCNHQQNKGSFAVSLPPDLQGEHISAGCWHDSGCKLFVAVQSSLVVYTWKDITNVAEFTSQVCSIPGLDGDICRIVSTLNGQLVVSVEMPIFDLLDDDMFENTAIADVAKLESDDEDESDDDSAEKTDEDRHNNNNVAEAAEDEVEDDDLVLRPCHQTDPGTHTQKLLNLELKSQHKMNHLSKLVQLNTEPDIITVAVAGIPYIMVPDLLHYHDATGTIIVGSNSNTQVYLYKAASMNKVNDIILKDNQRLKGIGTFTWPSKSVSIVGMMIGKVDIHDSAFPSSGSDKEYDLELQVFNNTNMEVMRPKANSVPALILNDTTHSDLSKKKHKDRNSSKLKDLKRPKTTKDSRESSHFDKLFRPFFGRSTMKGTKIIEVSRKNDEDAELELETINFSDQPAHFTVITSNQEAPQESKNSSFKLALSESHTKMASSGGLPAADVNPRNELTSRSNSLPNIIDEASAQEVKKNAEDKKSDTLERYIIEGAQKTQKPKKKKVPTATLR